MYVTIITDLNNRNDYGKITDINTTNNISNNCTNSESIIDINIPSILQTIQCGVSFLCLLSLMIYTLIKLLLTNK